MAIGSLVLGVINIAIVAAVLLLVGILIEWLCRMFGLALPDEARKIYLIIVLLIVLYMLAAMLFGLPSWRIIAP